MQILYALSRDTNLSCDHLLKQYRLSIKASFDLYLFSLYFLIRIAQYARTDAEKRQGKLLPSDEDLGFVAKLAENTLMLSLFQHTELSKYFNRLKFDALLDADVVRNLYQEYAKSDSYKNYVYSPDDSLETHRTVLLDLFKFCIGNETFIENLEDHFPNWIDDKSLIVGSIKKTLKALPAEFDFLEAYLPNDEAVLEFGETLLTQVCTGDKALLAIIEPTLKNWDADRVAVIDMILLKMAVCELMQFKSIPTKVTLNEFVEISKLYSTEKSKDFINGILDRLMKQLEKEGKIEKAGRGLLD